jgi:4-amino-4-deoxy-L-arabinose transferase-like glycosyltransferase
LEAVTVSAMPVTAAGSSSLDREQGDFLQRLVLYGFLLRVALAIVLEWTGWSARFAPDEETYAATGRYLALYWTDDVLVKPWRFSSHQPIGYFYINAVLFYLFGNSQMPVKVLNAFIGAFAARYVFLIARDLFGRAVARRSALLCEFFPSLVLWSVLNIRDVWVVFLILFIAWKSFVVVRGYSPGALVSVVLAALVLSWFRDYLFYVVATPPVVAFLIGRRGHLGRNFVLALAAGMGLLLLVQHAKAGATAVDRMTLEALSKARQDLATGGSTVGENVDISTPGRALAYLPTGLAYFMFSPFPWQITSALKLFALPEMLLIYALTPAMIRGIRYTVRTRLREALQILLVTSLLTVSYALGEGNVGTLYRHRAQAISMYLMFAAAGIELKKARDLQAGRAAA